MSKENHLRVDQTEGEIAIHRGEERDPILVQHAETDHRPFIHPIVAPDGKGVLTENAPPHHLWQHGLYIGLNDVNGVGFWKEGIRGDETDGTFHPGPLAGPTADQNRAMWEVKCSYRAPDGSDLFEESQAWRFTDLGDCYEIDLDWTIQASVELTFGEYPYGGLFIRMPYRKERGGEAVNSDGKVNREAEGERARWVAIHMPIEGRDDDAGMAMMDHPDNPDHPLPWRVDGQMGISPSRSILGAWRLGTGEEILFRHRVFVFCGHPHKDEIEASWQRFASDDRTGG